MKRWRDHAISASRAWQAWLITLALLASVLFMAPQQIGILPYKGTFISLGCLGGYWMHVWLFGHVEQMPGYMRLHASYQRTAIMCCAMLALGMGA